MHDYPNGISQAPVHKTLTRGLLGGFRPPAGLLGKHYSPEEERRKKISGAMLHAGIQLLTNGKGSFGEVLGQGLGGAVQGANQAGQDYRQDAFDFHQLEQQQADRQRQIENDTFNRNRLIKQDAWNNTERQYTLEQRQQADEEKQAKMVCQIMAGEFKIKKADKEFTLKEGEMYTCSKGKTDGNTNTSAVVGIHRVAILMPA